MADIEKQNSLIPLSQAVETIKTAILQGQYEALKGTNRIQLAVYFAIGKYLSNNTRRLPYGAGALKAISDQLLRELPGLRGYSATNLKYMRLFYEAWQMLDVDSSVATDNSQSTIAMAESSQESSVATDESLITKSSVVTDELQVADNKIDIYHSICIPNAVEFPVEDFFSVPFSHHVEIYQKNKDLEARYYYIHRTAREHLSVDALEKLIKQQAYEHRELMPNNFKQTISNSALARKAVMMFKDSYQLDFINTEEIGERDQQDIDEKVVEKQIIQNIKNFIMTFGNDFTFVGNQYHLEIYGEENFPDLLFFNRELNALVVVELKIGKFKPSYLGTLTSYLQILDAKVRKPHENPSIGIILCKSANKEFVELVIQGYKSPMGVATYTTSADMPEELRRALPDIEELKRVLNQETEKEKIVRT
ncbi:MAG: PDDEXK nuclease domain-containing protein [Sodaliphilus sp.]|mgnify:FL=1|nr:PDDEXK nuclease domain-containing protein [Bacteroidales bacterium]MDD7576794.1 PDDEXK nuclease domain-containing protein [Bacteroidales bacterium]MDY5868695.1 PDDEXK nuclease domain-containing protein [Sodaliphilus sp.]